MTQFDITDPPTTYRKFRKAILSSIEEAEVEEDEEYPMCLFLVNRENEADIVYPQEIIEELEEELDEEEVGDIPAPFVVNKIFPQKLKEFNSKFFAIVFQGTYTDEDGDIFDIVLVLSGCAPGYSDLMGEMDLLKAEIFVEEDGYCDLEPWEKMELDHLPELVTSFRRAIVNQG